MNTLVIEFSETKWKSMHTDSAIDIIQWLVSQFDSYYEMRKDINSDTVYFIGESEVADSAEKYIYELTGDFRLIRTDRLFQS